MKTRIGIAILLVLALSCGQPGKNTPPAPVTREFPMAEIPMMMSEPAQRAQWLALHFWDRFLAEDQLYTCDSVTVNGVAKEDVEKQMGLFASILLEIPTKAGQEALVKFYERLEAFQTAQPEGNVLKEAAALTSQYFYDPNSPVRNEELYLPFVSRLAQSALIEPESRAAYEWEVKVCSLNRPGTPAADFTFIDTAGKRRTLYGIRAPYTLLIFGNPDCKACKEIVQVFSEEPQLGNLIQAGTLQVVDIYIDEEIDVWKERMSAYPKDWINGYDPDYIIRTDRLYAVRAVPSLYLLDGNKTVLLKDAPENQIFNALLTL